MRKKIGEIKNLCVLVFQTCMDKETLELAKKVWNTEYEFPSLDGIVVEEECKECLNGLQFEDSGNVVPFGHSCDKCLGTGTITRQAEWGDVKIVATNDDDRMPVLACKEVGRLRVKG